MTIFAAVLLGFAFLDAVTRHHNDKLRYITRQIDRGQQR